MCIFIEAHRCFQQIFLSIDQSTMQRRQTVNVHTIGNNKQSTMFSSIWSRFLSRLFGDDAPLQLFMSSLNYTFHIFWIYTGWRRFWVLWWTNHSLRVKGLYSSRSNFARKKTDWNYAVFDKMSDLDKRNEFHWTISNILTSFISTASSFQLCRMEIP